MKHTVIKIMVSVIIAGVTGGGLWWLWQQRKDHKPEEQMETEYFFDRKKADETLKEEIEKDPRGKMIDIEAKITELFRDKYSGGILRDEDDPRAGDEHDIPREKLAKGVREYTAEEKKNFEEYMAAMESPEEDEDEDEYEEDEPEEDEKDSGPYPITAAQFCNSRSYYDKVSLNYYAEDDVVSDERDKVMENAEEVVGRLQEMFDGMEYPSICYIRNEELEIDYEISVIDSSYRREILHEEE